MSGPGRNNLIDASPSYSESQDDSDEAEQEPWIEWWTHLKGNEFLCEVSEEFLRDEFNLYGFSAQVSSPCSNFVLSKTFYSFATYWPFISRIVIYVLPQIPFYPYAISIILDDDPDINDQELDGQQQVFFPSCIVQSFEPRILLRPSLFLTLFLRI
jgi:hypothetical protein